MLNERRHYLHTTLMVQDVSMTNDVTLGFSARQLMGLPSSSSVGTKLITETVRLSRCSSCNEHTFTKSYYAHSGFVWGKQINEDYNSSLSLRISKLRTKKRDVNCSLPLLPHDNARPHSEYVDNVTKSCHCRHFLIYHTNQNLSQKDFEKVLRTL